MESLRFCRSIRSEREPAIPAGKDTSCRDIQNEAAEVTANGMVKVPRAKLKVSHSLRLENTAFVFWPISMKFKKCMFVTM